MLLIPDLRMIVYEYADILTIADYYDSDPEVFDKIIKKIGIKKERDFSLINLTYLKKNHIAMNINQIVKSGKLCNIQWMKECGYEFGILTFYYAIENGNLENMNWLKQNDCPLNQNIIRRALYNNNTSNIKKLEEEGYFKPVKRDCTIEECYNTFSNI
jgi:hypothetical protein